MATKPKSKTVKKSPGKAKATRTAKPKTEKVDINNLVFSAMTEASKAVESSLFRSSELEDVSGFYPGSLVLGLILGKIQSGFYIFSGPEQAAKCVTGDTMVVTQDGPCRIDSFITKDGKNPVEGISIMTHMGLMPISHTYKGDSSTIVTIKLETGQTLSGTPSHPLMVVNRDGTSYWEPMSKLSVGMSLAVCPKGVPDNPEMYFTPDRDAFPQWVKVSRIVSVDMIAQIYGEPYSVYDVVVPGLHAFLANGIVSHNSTAMATLLGQAFASGVQMVKHYDVERAMRSTYMGKVIAGKAGVKWDVLSRKDNPRYRWLIESTLEKIFAEMNLFLRSLPDKTYDSKLNTWFLVFDRRPEVAGKKAKKNPGQDIIYNRVRAVLTPHPRSTVDEEWFDVGDSPAFQIVYAVDSFKALMVKAIESGEKGGNQPGIMAKAFAESLPYVKAYLRDKHAVLIGVNQMYTNPLAGPYGGDGLYETAGNALKLHSDVRNVMKPCSIPKPFLRTAGTPMYVEPSVLDDDGTDYYTFKRVKNIKNKFSDPAYEGILRIWSKGPKVRPGICPVYDVAYFLSMIGMATIGSTQKDPAKVALRLANSEALGDLAGIEIPWMELKADIFTELGWMTGDHYGLMATCRKLLDSGEAHRLLVTASSNTKGKDHLGDSEDEE